MKPMSCLVLGLACLASLPVRAALQAEQASYEVSRDGKVIGSAHYALARNADGSWTLRSDTHGTSGMAKWLGLYVREASTFTMRDGMPQGLHYDYQQDASIKHKRRSIDFDWDAGTVEVRDNGKAYAYATRPGAIDRSAVAVALGLAVQAHGSGPIQLPVAVKDRIEEQRFAPAHASAAPTTRNGIEITRTDAPGKLRSWYEPARGVLPMRVEQTQHDGSVIVMQRAESAARD